MKIGLIDVDNHGVKKGSKNVYPNLALCKISAWHKANGDSVEWYDSLFSGHCDKVYVSKIFNFTPDIDFFIDADEVIRGGTGYDIASHLPDEMDRMTPDYSIYPYIPSDTAYGFLTRGCPNKCKWCVVPRKEGRIRPYMDIDEICVGGRTKAVLMDNNILAAGDYAKEQLRKIIERGYKVDFNQGLDARLVTQEFAELLAKVKWINVIRFACDTKAQTEVCERVMLMLRDAGYKGEFYLYTIISPDFVKSYTRIHYWWEKAQERRTSKLGGVYPHAQPYRNPDNPNQEIPQWQKDLARWVNKRMLFMTTDFADYSPRKGEYGRDYLKQYGLL